MVEPVQPVHFFFTFLIRSDFKNCQTQYYLDTRFILLFSHTFHRTLKYTPGIMPRTRANTSYNPGATPPNMEQLIREYNPIDNRRRRRPSQQSTAAFDGIVKKVRSKRARPATTTPSPPSTSLAVKPIAPAIQTLRPPTLSADQSSQEGAPQPPTPRDAATRDASSLPANQTAPAFTPVDDNTPVADSRKELNILSSSQRAARPTFKPLFTSQPQPASSQRSHSTSPSSPATVTQAPVQSSYPA